MVNGPQLMPSQATDFPILPMLGYAGVGCAMQAIITPPHELYNVCAPLAEGAITGPPLLRSCDERHFMAGLALSKTRGFEVVGWLAVVSWWPNDLRDSTPIISLPSQWCRCEMAKYRAKIALLVYVVSLAFNSVHPPRFSQPGFHRRDRHCLCRAGTFHIARVAGTDTSYYGVRQCLRRERPSVRPRSSKRQG